MVVLLAGILILLLITAFISKFIVEKVFKEVYIGNYFLHSVLSIGISVVLLFLFFVSILFTDFLYLDAGSLSFYFYTVALPSIVVFFVDF